MFTASMSSRSESKQAAREARRAAEQEEAAKQRKQRIWALAGGSVLLAAIVVVALIALSTSDSGSDEQASGDLAKFDGVPQRGIELGDPKAPVTLVEFADPQCPFCKAYTADDMPGLIDRYVAGGDLRMELQLLTFIGPDSEGLARAALAASEQDRMWQFMDVAYARQGTENTGYGDQPFIDGVAEAAGVDVDAMNAQTSSAAVSKKLEDAKAAAADAGINSTPSFLVGPSGGNLQPTQQDNLAAAIDQALAAAK